MENVDPLYWQYTLRELIDQFGYQWLKRQDELFQYHLNHKDDSNE